MKRLELLFHIKGLSVLYKEDSICWENAEFTSKSSFSADLKIWEDEVEPEQIIETWEILKDRFAAFSIAMKYKGNREFFCTQKIYPTYFYYDQIFTPKDEAEVQLLIKALRGEIQVYICGSGTLQALGGSCSVAINPAQLPQTMPVIPLCIRRIASTIMLADEMTNFPDQQLKLAYIVLEEFVKDKKCSSLYRYKKC